MKCTNCGNELPEGALFCDACGQKVVQADEQTEKRSFCGNCGAELLPGERFCGNCGCAADGGINPVGVNPAAERYQADRLGRPKVIIAVVAAVCLMAGAAVLGYNVMRSDKTDNEGENFVTASPSVATETPTATPEPTPTITPTPMPTEAPTPTDAQAPLVTYLPQSEVAAPPAQPAPPANDGGYNKGYSDGYEDASSKSSSESNAVTATYYVVNCKEYITLRSSPSTSASEITKIPLGQAVGFIENAGNGFYKINYNGNVGYALASYLSMTKDSSSSQSSTNVVAKVVHAKEYITLRAKPSTSASEITKIPAGAYVNYIKGADNGFYYVEYNGMRGYALASYLEIK